VDREFLVSWQDWYPDSPPLGFALRETYPELWLRIHSLPDGKRYPESDADRAELYRRQNTAASEVLGADANCMLVLFAACDSHPANLRRTAGLENLPGELRRLGQLEQRWQDDFFVDQMCFFGAESRWKPGLFDAFIESVADDGARGLFVETGLGRVYAPYYGGADLFFATEFERDAAAAKFANWRSDRVDRS
jgi:hypothetical protein